MVAERGACEQTVDDIPRVGEQVLTQDLKSRSKLPWYSGQILDVPVLELVKQWAKLPNTVDAPVPQVVEELAEASKVFSQDRVQRRFEGQIIKTPGISLAEKIIEMPVTQTRVAFGEDGKIAEKDLAVARLARLSLTLDFPVFQHVENPDEACEGAVLQFIDKAVDILEVPQLQHTDQVVGVPFGLVAQVSHVQVMAKTVEIPQSLFVEKTVMIPEIQTAQGPETSEGLSTKTTVAGKFDHETVVQGVAQNIQMDSFNDDLRSVGSQGLNRQDCEVLSHAGMKHSSSTVASNNSKVINHKRQGSPHDKGRRERKKEEREERKEKRTAEVDEGGRQREQRKEKEKRG